MRKPGLATTITLGTVLSLTFLLPGMAAKKKENPPRDGAKIFKQHCAKCHFGGGNSVEPKRPVIGSKQLGSLAVFKTYLSAPPGHMPYYAQVVNDRETLDALYKYCKSLKQPIEKETMLPSHRTQTISLKTAGPELDWLSP